MKNTGQVPVQDDLERVNCKILGKGHDQCGICLHNRPKFMGCTKCQRKEQIIVELLQDFVALLEEDMGNLRGQPVSDQEFAALFKEIIETAHT